MQRPESSGSAPDRALLRAYPALGSQARVRLGIFPTPIEPLDIGRRVPGFRGKAWVKREDLSGSELGGNKLRKLELLLGSARASGARAFVTVAGIGSNHALACAFYGPEAGLEPHVVVFPHDVTPTSRRTLRAVCALGARIAWSPSRLLVPFVAGRRWAALAAAGRRPSLIWPGGSSPTGVLGTVDLGLELAEQIHAGELERPDAVFVAYGSGGTAAGLALGLALGDAPCDVVAVRVYDLPATTRMWLRVLAGRARRRISELAGTPLPRLDPARLRVQAGYLGRRYAAPTEAGSAAREVGSDLGLELEPTYTAKAFAAFLDAAAGQYRDARLVFVQTYDARLPEGLDVQVPDELVPARLRRYV